MRSGGGDDHCHTVKPDSPADVLVLMLMVAVQDPTGFGLSVCTVDGQRFDIGDVDVDFR